MKRFYVVICLLIASPSSLWALDLSEPTTPSSRISEESNVSFEIVSRSQTPPLEQSSRRETYALLKSKDPVKLRKEFTTLQARLKDYLDKQKNHQATGHELKELISSATKTSAEYTINPRIGLSIVEQQRKAVDLLTKQLTENNKHLERLRKRINCTEKHIDGIKKRLTEISTETLDIMAAVFGPTFLDDYHSRTASELVTAAAYTVTKSAYNTIINPDTYTPLADAATTTASTLSNLADYATKAVYLLSQQLSSTHIDTSPSLKSVESSRQNSGAESPSNPDEEK